MKTFLIYSHVNGGTYPLEVIETDFSEGYAYDYAKERFKDYLPNIAVMRIDHTKIFKNIDEQLLVKRQE